MEIFKLFGSIFINSDDANKKIEDTDKKGQGVAKTLGNMAGTAAKWGSAIVGAASTAVGGLLALTNKTAEYADEIDKLSERTGINREELQRWKFAAEDSGADVGKLEQGMKSLSEAIDGAINGSEKNIEAFGKLGISMNSLRTKSPEELFTSVMNGLGDMTKGAERNALGNDLLGRSFTEMLPLLNAGSKGMQDLKDKADSLGLVMSEDMIKANVEFGDSMEALQKVFGAIGMGLTNSTLPMLQDFTDFLIGNAPNIKKIFGGLFETIGSAVKAVLPFLMDLISNILPPLMSIFTDIAKKILPPLITIITKIAEIVLPIVTEAFNIFKGVIDIVAGAIGTLTDFFVKNWDALQPILIGVGAGAAAFGLYTLAINASAIATGIWTTVTGIAAGAAKAFGAVLSFITSPIGIVVLAIAALVAAGVAIIKNWDAIKKFLVETWGKIKEFAISVFEGIGKFFEKIIDGIVGVAKKFGKAFSDIWEGIGKAVKSIWDGIVNAVKDAINFIVKGINAFLDGINFLTSGLGALIGVDLRIPHIPLLANGGEITKSGKVIVGEAGPEILDVPEGAKVKPLSSINEPAAPDTSDTFIFNVDFSKINEVQKMMDVLDGVKMAKRAGAGAVIA